LVLTTTEAILTTFVVISQQEMSGGSWPNAGTNRVRFAARRRVAIFMAVVSVDAYLE
jgi:hypothetical protein